MLPDFQPQDSQPCDNEDLVDETKTLPRSDNKSRRRQQSALPSNHDIKTITSSIAVPLLLSMPPSTRLLVCSIGNPGPYLNTLHSAGHTVLLSLAHSLGYPSFAKSRTYGNGLVSSGSDYTLWQSPSLMNVSGSGVAAAWKQFLKDTRGEGARLVIVHDELELRPGEVKVKKGDASPKGHNGLKSIKDQMRSQEWWRIGVGIGRPESRDPQVVAGYVLRKMTMVEKGKIEGAVGRIEAQLMQLAAGG